MADNSNQFMNDFLRQMSQNSTQTSDGYNRILDSLSSVANSLDEIDSKLQRILANPRGIPSQSAARDERVVDSNRPFGQHHANNVGRRDNTWRNSSDAPNVDLSAITDLLQRAVTDLHRLRSIDSNVQLLLSRRNATSNNRPPTQQAINNSNTQNHGWTNSSEFPTEDLGTLISLLQQSLPNLDKLNSIDSNLSILIGQQNATSDISRGQTRNPFNTDFRRDPFDEILDNSDQTRKVYKGFLEAFEESLIGNLGGEAFKSRLKEALNTFAEHLGVEIEGVGDDLGEQFGRMFANNIRNSPIGQEFLNSFNQSTNGIFSRFGDIGDLFNNLRNNPNADISDFAEGLKNIDLGRFGNALVAGGDDIAEFIGRFIGKGNAWMLLIDAGAKVASSALKNITKNLQLAQDGIHDFWEGIKAVANRYYTSLEGNQKYAQERLVADMHTLIETPFDILKKAANEVYDAWNANIRLITGTQGYDKADLQDLMSIYGQRLQSEGLDRVVATTDVYNNLAKVIQSGLTGNAAVEFAYQATRYNAAIPNQDFFQYVDTYSSIAANAIAAGKSEAEALQIANNSLEDFSNSLLYASRNLTGGFSTGLKDVSNIYSSAVKITQAANSDNINGIASSLLAIQGYVGSIAPDLASTLSDKIYQLATGGNNADIVALRSLAGVNASNTEFLRALIQNPQSVLSSMFANLGKMYASSNDAFMEKAEGYASLFGLSSEAFQRIDFMSLANAISNMSTNSNSLDENMKLLKEGQTTTNADQMKIAQINQYMIEEGLAYVIDNEAAQMIQEHMWDEQMKRELMEAEYGVDLVGNAASGLRKIITGIENILNLLNPIAWLSKIGNIVRSVDEAKDITSDVKAVLEAGVVGQGSRKDLYNLTTRNQDLELTENLVDMLGGKSRYGNSWYDNNAVVGAIGGLSHPFTGLYNLGKQALGQLRVIGSSTTGGGPADSLPSSNYSWGSISKSSAALSSALLSQTTGEVEERIVSNVTGAVSTSVAIVQSKIEHMLSDEYLYEQYAKTGKSYEEWKASAKDFGITDIDSALTESGYNPEEVETYFAQKQTAAGMAKNYEDTERERTFYDAGTQFWNTRFWEEYNVPLTGLVNTVIGQVDSMIALQTEWRDVQLVKLQEITDNQINWKLDFDTSFAEYRVQFDTDWENWHTLYTETFTAFREQFDLAWTDWRDHFSQYQEQFDTAWFNWQEFFNTTWIEEAWKTNFVGDTGAFTEFFNEFVKKFVTHEYYDASGYNYRDVVSIQQREDAKKGDAVNALADALTANMVDLKDPQVQTNALLSQILVVATAIMNQNNNVAGTVSLSDALTSLALGLTTTTAMTETPVQSPAIAGATTV